MERMPRNPNEKLLTLKTLGKSIVQGVVLFIASFGTYFAVLTHNSDNALLARTMGLVVIILANLFLVQVNSSDSDFAIESFILLIKDKVMWAVNIGTLAMLGVILYSPLNVFLKLTPLSVPMLFTAAGISAAAVFWYEIIKLIKKLRKKQQ